MEEVTLRESDGTHQIVMSFSPLEKGLKAYKREDQGAPQDQPLPSYILGSVLDILTC